MRLNISIQHYDKPLLVSVLFLCAFGTIMLYSASWNESYIRSGGLTESLFLKNHLKRISIGFLCLFAALIFDYRNLKPIASYLLAVSLILLIITKGYYLINGIKSPARWLNLGFFSFQTSDIARLSLIIFLSYYLDQIKNSEGVKDELQYKVALNLLYNNNIMYLQDIISIVTNQLKKKS